MTMQAVLKTHRGHGNTELVEIPVPEPGPRQIKAEISFCGICGTDRKIVSDDHAYYRPPMVLGHEFSAVVAEVGEQVTRVQPGDEIVVAPLDSRVTLHQRHGWDRPDGRRRGFETAWGIATYGGMTRFGVYEEDAVLRLPPGVDLQSAAMTEPLAVCTRGIVSHGEIRATDLVVVSGPGPIGLLAAQIAKAEGGYVVVCGVDGDEAKLEVARELGVDAVYNVEREDPLPHLLDLTAGGGADVLIECSGHGSSVNRLFDYGRRGAQFIQLGTSMHRYEIDFMQIAYKELKVVGSFGYHHRDWERSLQLMSTGKVDPRPLISHTMPMSEWRQAFDTLQDRQGIKILLYPDR